MICLARVCMERVGVRETRQLLVFLLFSHEAKQTTYCRRADNISTGDVVFCILQYLAGGLLHVVY